MRINRIVLGIIAVALLAAGCSGTGSHGSSVPPASEGTTSAAAASVSNQLGFTAKTVDGQDFSGASLAGAPAVLWFWAPWCPTCQREAPEVAALAHAQPGVRFVGVASLDQQPAMQNFVQKYDLGFFPNLADVDGSVWRSFRITAQPAFVFIDKNGAVATVRGPLSESDLRDRVQTLIAR